MGYLYFLLIFILKFSTLILTVKLLLYSHRNTQQWAVHDVTATVGKTPPGRAVQTLKSVTQIQLFYVHLSSVVGLPDCTRSTQPCIPPGSLNRVPASAGVRAGMSPLPGGR